MKRLISSLCIIAALLAVWNAPAADFQVISFLNSTDFVLTNNATVTYGDTVAYTNKVVKRTADGYGGYTQSYTNISTNAALFADVPIWWTGPNSNSIGNIMVEMVNLSTNTNTVTLTFSRMVGTNFGSTAGDKFAVAVLMETAGTHTIMTNLPPWFTHGAEKIRLYSIATASSTGNPRLKKVSLNGWRP